MWIIGIGITQGEESRSALKQREAASYETASQYNVFSGSRCLVLYKFEIDICRYFFMEVNSCFIASHFFYIFR